MGTGDFAREVGNGGKGVGTRDLKVVFLGGELKGFDGGKLKWPPPKD